MQHIIYPENRYVTDYEVVVWAHDDLVNGAIKAGDHRDIEEIAASFARPTIEEAMQILEDSGSVTFVKIPARFSDPAYLKAERNVTRSQKAIRRAV
jgi:hypothetical protein